MSKNKGLGRGLSALIGENILAEEAVNNSRFQIELNKIFPNPRQPRVVFKADELENLSKSIELNGVLQPLILREVENNRYEIIAGERRWRAAKLAGLISVPAIIRDASEKEVFEVALIENIQREDLNPMEEAEAYNRLLNEYSYTQEQVARTVSKSRSHVANLLRLLNLPETIKTALKNNEITLGHAKLLINKSNSEEVLEEIISNKMSVRELESVLSGVDKKNNQRKLVNSYVNDDITSLENYLCESLGLEVKIQITKTNTYKVTINEISLDQLDIIATKLSSSVI